MYWISLIDNYSAILEKTGLPTSAPQNINTLTQFLVFTYVIGLGITHQCNGSLPTSRAAVGVGRVSRGLSLRLGYFVKPLSEDVGHDII